jgi:hypothetical protein
MAERRIKWRADELDMIRVEIDRAEADIMRRPPTRSYGSEASIYLQARRSARLVYVEALRAELALLEAKQVAQEPI